jgi:hypothetical protein
MLSATTGLCAARAARMRHVRRARVAGGVLSTHAPPWKRCNAVQSEFDGARAGYGMSFGDEDFRREATSVRAMADPRLPRARLAATTRVAEVGPLLRAGARRAAARTRSGSNRRGPRAPKTIHGPAVLGRVCSAWHEEAR